jgi:hypothetical protein
MLLRRVGWSVNDEQDDRQAWMLQGLVIRKKKLERQLEKAAVMPAPNGLYNVICTLLAALSSSLSSCYGLIFNDAL